MPPKTDRTDRERTVEVGDNLGCLLIVIVLVTAYVLISIFG